MNLEKFIFEKLVETDTETLESGVFGQRQMIPFLEFYGYGRSFHSFQTQHFSRGHFHLELNKTVHHPLRYLTFCAHCVSSLLGSIELLLIQHTEIQHGTVQRETESYLEFELSKLITM